MDAFFKDVMAAGQFLACDTPWDQAKVGLFGAPFDGTTSFRPGTRFGPSAMRQVSDSMEDYSPYQDKLVEDALVCDLGDIELPMGDTAMALDLIEDTCRHILEAGKKPAMLGGEHLVTLGTVRALAEKYPDLHILHFDAHTDLRDDFLGVELSHATVIKKCWDILGDGRIHSFGIRSGLREEFVFGHDHLDFHPFLIGSRNIGKADKIRTREELIRSYQESIDELARTLKEQGTPLYITLDLDVFDPGIMPGTGTLEAGGLSFLEVLDLLFRVEGTHLVGFDINELSPPYDPTGQSTALALKLLREMLLLL
jgi:agmatinase